MENKKKLGAAFTITDNMKIYFTSRKKLSNVDTNPKRKMSDLMVEPEVMKKIKIDPIM